MSRRRVRSLGLVLGMLIAAAGCKSKDKKKSEATPKEATPEKAEPAKKKKKRGYLDRGLTMGKSALYSGKKHGADMASKGKELGTEAYRKTRRWGSATIDEVRDEAVAIMKATGGDIVAAGAQINALLEGLARDPDGKITTADKVTRMIVLMVPIVGPTKRYIDARKLYETGVEKKDEARIQEARREALIAFTEAGLDIGVLGLVGGQIDLVATGADKVLKLLKVSRRVGTLAGANLDTFDNLLDAMLTNDEIRDSVDAALTIDLSKISVSN